MTTVYKKDKGLIPVSDEAQEQYEKIKAGDLVEVKVVKKRNLKWHNKFFADINDAFPNQEMIDNITAFRDYCLSASGFGIMIKIDDNTKTLCRHLCKQDDGSYITDKEGFYWYVRGDSMSFGSMDQETFEEVHAKVKDTIYKTFGIDVSLLSR